MTERCLCTSLRQAAAFSTAHYDAVLAPAGIKITMFRLLRRIDEAGCVSISDLAGIVGLDRSTLGRNLRVLEKQDLIATRPGQDQRERVVELTDHGRRTLETALPLWRSAQDSFAALLGPDVLTILEGLADLNKNQETYEGDRA
ncbi:MarR family winged helix-turn-helix transcriptional regulator [Tropicimonas isoalkanivorans]|uniref:Transcriptional regulator, MarR family n=1 Tax=Tropicimonas isoalkanivorans TaxID=441112 RepID=A0A1I1Q7P6_9RHOB|nr:MarR family winged helix-turn-helix transcriptional regulator [Tropicimonas isoalkanivorans]SFD15253.1 transcriptional regulator, MarR family [Tropicimonas isoalkanivorans]